MTDEQFREIKSSLFFIRNVVCFVGGLYVGQILANIFSAVVLH